MFCTNCGSKFEDGNSFCPNCGTKVETVVQPLETATPVASPVESVPVAAAAVVSEPIQAAPLGYEPIKATPLEPAPAPAPAPAPVTPVQPVYNQPMYAQPTYVAPVNTTPGTDDPALAKSILILGIIAVASACTFFLSAAGIICGAIGLAKAKKFTEECGQIFGQAKVGKFLSLGGLIGSSVITAYVLLLIITAIISEIA